MSTCIVFNGEVYAYPADNENVIIVPQTMAAGEFNPYTKGEKSGGAGKERPQAGVQLFLGVDVAVVGVIVLPRLVHHSHCGARRTTSSETQAKGREGEKGILRRV